MHIDITIERHGGTPAEGPATVGWLLDTAHTAVIFDPPTRVNTGGARDHAKSASRCPAIRDLESRYWQVAAPFDLEFGFVRRKSGEAMLVNRQGDASSVRTSILDDWVHLVAEEEWRFPDRPLLQLRLPYLFVADEPVYLSQVPPFAGYTPRPLPGVMLSGRFPIDVWPRPLQWAFEWHDISVDVSISRGEPLFYCGFECDDPGRSVRVVEARMTPELREYIDHLSGAVNYVKNTFGLFDAAARVRPTSLVEPVRRNASDNRV